MLKISLLLLVFTLVACATGPAYPPIVESPTDEWHPGTFVWNDLITKDVETAKRFYGDLFGWTFTGDGEYVLVHHAGRPIGGIAFVPGEKLNSARWLPSLSHPDPAAGAESIAASGGKVHEGPPMMRGRGAAAFVVDPQGASLILLRSDHGDPAATDPVDGGWLFTVIWTTVPYASLNFYESLAGWERKSFETPKKTPYWLFLADGEPKAGLAKASGEQREAVWLPVVKVNDPAAIAAKATAAGGKVIVAQGAEGGDGNITLIEDPGGAAFLVEKWSAGPEVTR